MQTLRQTVGWLDVDTCYHEAIAVIDGVEYPSVRRWHINGGRYSEQFFYNGHFYDSYKKMIERILESTTCGDVSRAASSPDDEGAKFKQGQWVRVTRNDGTTVEGTIRDWNYNARTSRREYSLDYMRDGRCRTMICIPEANIEIIG